MNGQIHFTEISTKGTTRLWLARIERDNTEWTEVGTVSWSEHRQYAFTPSHTVALSKKALTEIAAFCAEQTSAHYRARSIHLQPPATAPEHDKPEPEPESHGEYYQMILGQASMIEHLEGIGDLLAEIAARMRGPRSRIAKRRRKKD